MLRLTVLMLIATLAFAGGKTYSLRLFEPSVIAGSELQPGEYRLEVDGDKAVIRQGRKATEANVKVETNGEKYRSTSVRYAVRDGKNHVLEIRLGGTNTKLAVN